MGSIVYVEKGLYQVSTQSPLLVIDGQQCLVGLREHQFVAAISVFQWIEHVVVPQLLCGEAIQRLIFA